MSEEVTLSTAAIHSQTPPRLNPYLIRSALVAALGGLLFGFDTAVIAGATRALTGLYSLSPAMLGFTVASALWGTVLGSLVAGPPSDRYGRLGCLRALGVLYVLSAFGRAFAWSWYALICFRFVGGIAIGGSSVLGPMYIAEIAPAKWRGRLVGFFQFNVVFGILLAYLSNYLIGTMSLGETEWRWKLGISALPAALFFLMLFAIPRSPRWLVKKGRIEEAGKVLMQLGDSDEQEDLRHIVASIDAEHAGAKQRLFSRRFRFPILLAVLVAMFNQLAGINSILSYLNDIFARAGFTKVSGDLQAVVIGATNLIFT